MLTDKRAAVKVAAHVLIQDVGQERLQGQALSEDAGHHMECCWLDINSRCKCLLSG